MGIGSFKRLLLLLLLSASGLNHGSCSLVHQNASSAEFVPVGEAEIRPVFNESRRRLGNFQVCALCTCCSGGRHLCVITPCCYAIACNIPNRPFGLCSFVPRTCNCLGCHL
ncbi:unnamed protein product [Victoria cruziana]